MPEYIFNGRGNYGYKEPSAEEWKAAYESAPACHHASQEMGAVALYDLGVEEQAAVVANSAAQDLDADWFLLEASEAEEL